MNQEVPIADIAGADTCIENQILWNNIVRAIATHSAFIHHGNSG